MVADQGQPLYFGGEMLQVPQSNKYNYKTALQINTLQETKTSA